MVHSDEHKKYVTIDNVRAFYRAKDDTIHLTSTDPDVQAGGFHLTLNRGTQTEATIRELLLEHQVMRQPNSLIPRPDGEHSSTHLPEKGHIISFISAGRVTDKTKTAVSLGIYLANKSQKKVIVVDLDAINGDIRFMVDSFQAPTILNATFTTSIELEHIVLTPEGVGCDFLLAPKRPRTAHKVTPELVKGIVERLAEEYDVVILNAPLHPFDTKGSWWELELYEQVIYPMSHQIFYDMQYIISEIVRFSEWYGYTLENMGDPEAVMAKTSIVISSLTSDTPPDWYETSKVDLKRPVTCALPLDTTLADASAKDLLESLNKKSLYMKAIGSLATA